MTAVLSSISLLMFATVFISRAKNDYWIFRIMEYPRLQKLFLASVLIVAWLITFPLENATEYISFGLLIVATIYLVYKIYPYTLFCKKEMLAAAPDNAAPTLKVFTANVLQDNEDYERMLEQIRAENPDIVFLVETNKQWCKAMEVLKKDYPHCIEQPLENTYGLLFYSRLPVDNMKINFLVKEDIPSLEATILLKDGQKVLLFGLHPEPPVPGENLYATAKDKELMKVALKVKECKCPCIVFGDLNDVAWSHTTELFRKTSRLLDPRIGRGFYATFSAHNRLLRFPLDYIFCSDHFRLAEMKRMPKNGSDHFATSVTLAFVPQKKQEQEAPQADTEELQEAKEKAVKLVPS
ncbi:MAG TPA: endonuclease/exonuclease/phosphatase family protein [Flavipsychrobacter sp.]|nr:endonuclease/exonuclease/phosphatase family protein [Flavipsychrobacter sp.]